MMKRSSVIWLVVGALLVAGAGGGLWWGLQGSGASDLVWEAIPPRPPLDDAPPSLARRIEAAEDEAYDGPDHLGGLKDLIRLYHANGFMAEARHGYEGLRQIEPDNPRWAHYLASILANYGELDAAIAQWEEVVAMAPDFVPARVRLGDSLLKRNEDAAADDVYAAALEREPENAYAWVGRGRVAMNREDWEAARAHLRKATVATDDRIGGDLLATVYEQLGQMDAAMDLHARSDRMGSFTDQPDPWLDDLLPVCYDPFRLAVSGGLAAFGGHREKGLRWLRRAAELSPEDANIRFQLGYLFFEMGKLDEAQAAFEKTLQINPQFSDGWLRLADVLRAKGLPGSAGRVILEGLEQCPDSPALHLTYGRHLADRGMYAAALGELQTSIRLRPDEADGHNALALVLFKMNRPDEAVEALHGALEAEPGNPFALSSLTMHSILSGDAQEAAPLLRRCQAHPRLQGEVLEDLEDAYRRQFGALPEAGA